MISKAEPEESHGACTLRHAPVFFCVICQEEPEEKIYGACTLRHVPFFLEHFLFNDFRVTCQEEPAQEIYGAWGVGSSNAAHDIRTWRFMGTDK